MSSKIIKRAQPGVCQPFNWPVLGSGLSQPAAPRSHEDDSRSPALREQQIERRAGEAHQAGYAEGEAAGRVRTQAQQRPAHAAADQAQALAELAALRPQLRHQAEGDVMRLAVAIARRVLRRELTVDPQAIQGLLKAALAQIQVQEVNRVRVHPEHEAAVRACLASCGSGTRIEVVGDTGLELGAALFETDRGNLDASVETQLQEIERGLADRFGSTS